MGGRLPPGVAVCPELGSRAAVAVDVHQAREDGVAVVRVVGQLGPPVLQVGTTTDPGDAVALDQDGTIVDNVLWCDDPAGDQRPGVVHAAIMTEPLLPPRLRVGRWTTSRRPHPPPRRRSPGSAPTSSASSRSITATAPAPGSARRPSTSWSSSPRWDSTPSSSRASRVGPP